MKNQYNLKRFVSAQELDYKNALEEVENGKKQVIGCGSFFLNL